MDGAACFLPEQRLRLSGSLSVVQVRTDDLREQGLPAVEVLLGGDGVEDEEKADFPAVPEVVFDMAVLVPGQVESLVLDLPAGVSAHYFRPYLSENMRWAFSLRPCGFRVRRTRTR